MGSPTLALAAAGRTRGPRSGPALGMMKAGEGSGWLASPQHANGPASANGPKVPRDLALNSPRAPANPSPGQRVTTPSSGPRVGSSTKGLSDSGRLHGGMGGSGLEVRDWGGGARRPAGGRGEVAAHTSSGTAGSSSGGCAGSLQDYWPSGVEPTAGRPGPPPRPASTTRGGAASMGWGAVGSSAQPAAYESDGRPGTRGGGAVYDLQGRPVTRGGVRPPRCGLRRWVGAAGVWGGGEWRGEAWAREAVSMGRPSGGPDPPRRKATAQTKPPPPRHPTL
jgi:hypothetical protein